MISSSLIIFKIGFDKSTDKEPARPNIKNILIRCKKVFALNKIINFFNKLDSCIFF